MNEFFERQLKKVLGAKAHDPDPEKMTPGERRDAEAAMRGSGRGMVDTFADDSESARAAARAASETGHPEMETELVDSSVGAEEAAEIVNEIDGSHQRTELAGGATAEADAIQAQGVAPHPRSDFVDGSAGAREAARRANEPKDMTAAEKEEQKQG